jgi:hypothetical protein
MFNGSSWLLLSKRVGCVRMHPVYRLNYVTVCLK